MPPEKNNSTHFSNIDILRGFAACSVVVYHVIEHMNWTGFPNSGPLVWFRIGWVGVDLFFVISGFVIALTAFSGIDKKGPEGFRKPFMLRRLTRIAPLHYFTMLIFLAFISPVMLFGEIGINLATHLLFIHNWFLEYSGSINGVNWSLGTEMQFYFLMAIIAPWLRRVNWISVAVLFVAIAWAWRLGAALSHPLRPGESPFAIFFFSTQLPGMLDEFAAGIIVAKIVRHGLSDGLAANAMRFALPLLLMVFIGIGVTALQLLLAFAGTFWENPIMVVFFRSLLAVGFGLGLFLVCFLQPTGVLRYLLAPANFLGTISYGIYLWHLPVILCIKRIEWLGPNDALPVVLGLTILLATVSWFFFEEPILKRTRGLLA